MLTDVAIPGDRNVIKQEAQKILKHEDNRNSAHVECESKSDTVITWATGTISNHTDNT
jgi:hypothetical protein